MSRNVCTPHMTRNSLFFYFFPPVAQVLFCFDSPSLFPSGVFLAGSVGRGSLTSAWAALSTEVQADLLAGSMHALLL